MLLVAASRNLFLPPDTSSRIPLPRAPTSTAPKSAPGRRTRTRERAPRLQARCRPAFDAPVPASRPRGRQAQELARRRRQRREELVLSQRSRRLSLRRNRRRVSTSVRARAARSAASLTTLVRALSRRRPYVDGVHSTTPVGFDGAYSSHLRVDLAHASSRDRRRARQPPSPLPPAGCEHSVIYIHVSEPWPSGVPAGRRAVAARELDTKRGVRIVPTHDSLALLVPKRCPIVVLFEAVGAPRARRGVLQRLPPRCSTCRL